MAFGTAKDRDASNRFMLIRLEPGRHVSNDLSLVSSLYQMTFPFSPVSKVERNGSELTEDSTTPTVNDHYHFDETTGLLRMKLAAAPDDDTNVIIVFYHLFYTGESTRYIAENPSAAVSASNPVREWRPRIKKYPSIAQTSRNITAGILSIASTSMEIINTDNDMQQHLTPEDSFSNKDCKIWLVIDDISAIDKVYDGRIKSLSLKSGSVNISVFDPFTKLSNPALMADPSDEAYFRRKTGSFPNVRPEDHDKPIPLVFGKQTKGLVSEDVPLVFGSVEGESHFVLESYEAVCTDYTNVDSATDATKKTSNRQWGCCRTNSSGLRTQTLGTATRRYDEGGGIHHYYISGHDINIGETVRGTTGGSPATVYGYCLWNETYQISGSDYNLKLCNNSNTMISLSGFQPLDTVAIFIYQSGFLRQIPLRHGRDYNAADLFTSGGNKYVRITFNNNFEDYAQSVGGDPISPLNPNTDHVYFVAYSAAVDSHADALKRIIQKTGLTVNTASFTQADTDLTALSRFTIPLVDESDFGDYRSYCEEILKSTLGLLKINSSDEVVYEIIAAPSSSDVTDSGIYIDKTLSINVDYNDVTTELIGYNPHMTNDAIDLEASDTSSAKSSDNKAKYLHGIDNTVRIKHVLDRIDNRIDDILAVRANRRARYKFKTSTQHLDSLIGDDMQLDSSTVLGDTESVDLKITKIVKDGASVSIEAEDLEGL